MFGGSKEKRRRAVFDAVVRRRADSYSIRQTLDDDPELLTARDVEAACRKLRQTMLSNPYIVPFMLGEDYEMIDMRHGSNMHEPEWAEMTPRAFLGLWSDEEKAWAREVYHGDKFTSVRQRWIEIHRKPEDTPRGAERSRLCEQARRVEEGEA